MTDAGLVRFFRGSILLGSTPLMPDVSLCEHAEAAEVEIPTSCTSGTCGTCMVTLLSGDFPLPKELTPGIDDPELVERNARLACIGIPKSSVDVDVLPPL